MVDGDGFRIEDDIVDVRVTLGHVVSGVQHRIKHTPINSIHIICMHTSNLLSKLWLMRAMRVVPHAELALRLGEGESGVTRGRMVFRYAHRQLSVDRISTYTYIKSY